MIQSKGYQRKDATVADIFRQNATKHPNKVAILMDDEEWTFAQVIIIIKQVHIHSDKVAKSDNLKLSGKLNLKIYI